MKKRHLIETDNDEFWNSINNFKLLKGFRNVNSTILFLLEKGLKSYKKLKSKPDERNIYSNEVI